ncbi:MAG TPA: Na+/H+ antiporter NhaA [Caulobacteraceae bacterium]|nr:Na+/H+ antiporter NhaA [Caulobacteraceae bacterium]
MRRVTLDYLRTETGSGLILIGAAAAAIALANSPWSHAYQAALATPLEVRIGGFAQSSSLAGWARSGLMAVFFLVLGMELKFELLRGELAGPRRFALPAFAAVGGIVGPALVYMAIDPGGSAWPAACATDDAVVLALLGVAAPGLGAPLRVLLMSLALADNLAAAVIAALVAPGAVHAPMLVGALTVLALLALLSRWRRAPFLFYAAGIVLVWGFALKSGLDPALAGAAAALTVPVGARRPGQESTLKYFMESLHPYVAFVILPLFVFSAAGFTLAGSWPRAGMAAPVLGLVLALWLGKPLGVFGMAALGVALRLARRPSGAHWVEIAGVALMSGAGFTISFYVIGDGPGAAPLRLAATAASLLSAASGAALLAWTQERRRLSEAELAPSGPAPRRSPRRFAWPPRSRPARRRP